MDLQNTKAAAVGLFLGTLLLGVVIGVFADRMWLRPDGPFMGMRPHEGRPGPGGFFMKHFAAELDLSSRQQAQLDSILSGNRQQFEALRRSLHPRFSALRDSLDQQILAILTPEQRERFDAVKKQRMSRRREWREGRP